MIDIQDINGRPMVRLGGEFLHKQRVTGDIVSEYTWHHNEPVMILYRAVPTEKVGAYMIELKDAHHYAQSNGYPTMQLIRHSHEAAKAMGFQGYGFEVTRIADIILDGLDDLLMMPPEPPESEKANTPEPTGSELVIKVNGETVMEKEV